MTTLTRLELPAVFGKLPAHGDFVSRGVPGALREKLDEWLSQWLSQAQAAHGQAFTEVYENAAPWLFDGPGAAAVLLPSMDAVGRHYPLLVVTAPACLMQDIYDAAVDALVTGATSDDLRAQLAALEPDPQTPALRTARWFLPEGAEGAEGALPVPDSLAAWPLVEGCFA
ncbi:MAG: type VI secretion system-associated protein TagF [Porphyrobacter sp.]|nr:type VI secretion system-associated protein TagF [Porphyrobacter sp.]